MNAHEPALSVAPPLSAWPLVHPPASRAPIPESAPPAAASQSRPRTETRGPFSIVRASRRAAAAERKPPAITPSTSNTSHALSGCP